MLNTNCAIFLAAVASLIMNDSALAQQAMSTTSIGHMAQDLNQGNGTRLRFTRTISIPQGLRVLCFDSGNVVSCDTPTPSMCRLELKNPSTNGPLMINEGAEIRFPDLGTCEGRGGDMALSVTNDPNSTRLITVERMICGSDVRPSVVTAYTIPPGHTPRDSELFTDASWAQQYCAGLNGSMVPGARVTTCSVVPAGRTDSQGNALYQLKMNQPGAQWNFGPESLFDSLGCYNASREAVQRAFLAVAVIENVAQSAASGAAPTAETINNAPPSKGLNSSGARSKASSAQ